MLNCILLYYLGSFLGRGKYLGRIQKCKATAKGKEYGWRGIWCYKRDLHAVGWKVDGY